MSAGTHNRVPGIGWRAITKLQLEKKDSYLQTGQRHGLPAENGWRLGCADSSGWTTASWSPPPQQLRPGRSKSDEHYDPQHYLHGSTAPPSATGRHGDLRRPRRRRPRRSRSTCTPGQAFFNSLQYPTRGYGLDKNSA